MTSTMCRGSRRARASTPKLRAMSISSSARILLTVTILCGIAAPAATATCPFGIPVITIPPHTQNGYSWGNVIRPMNDACVDKIVVDPTSDLAWYVGSFNGLYMTKTGGQTWTKPINGQVHALYMVPGMPNLVYAAVDYKLYLSRDAGTNWNVIKTFNYLPWSILVANGSLYVGLAWWTHAVPSGVYSMNLGGGGMQFHPFGPGHTGLLVWTLSHDLNSGAIYAGTEIFDHPNPYMPKFFRTLNGGAVWTDQTGALTWHVVDSAVRPTDGYVYALTEGYGVHGSATMGGDWIPPQVSPASGGLWRLCCSWIR